MPRLTKKQERMINQDFGKIMIFIAIFGELFTYALNRSIIGLVIFIILDFCLAYFIEYTIRA